tara:strand:+ start:793 stop:1125 length:333 start_codon:yes stop_codon:yes gene_type:complete
MDSEYFEKYFNVILDANKLKAAKIYLCIQTGASVIWNSGTRKLSIESDGFEWTFPLDKCVRYHLKKSYQRVFNETENIKWNDIGNPIKTELLAYLRQLYQLDGSLTKPAK